MTTVAWVVGAGGLLGRAVTRAANNAEQFDRVLAESLDWSDDAVFDSQVESLIRQVPSDASWSIFWCAGSSVVGSTAESIQTELARLARFLGTIERARTAGRLGTNGLLFYASSAGGVYAGSENPPFKESTVPVPLSAYGRAKLEAESVVGQFSDRSGVATLIGRISNLYGADQRIEKSQGILSQLCKSSMGGPPTAIYVSLDTIRDYIQADDCAALILDAMSELGRTAGHPLVVKILASQQPTTLASIIRIFWVLFKRPPNVMLGRSAHSAVQARDLRFISEVWPHLDARVHTPLPAGINAIAISMVPSVR